MELGFDHLKQLQGVWNEKYHFAMQKHSKKQDAPFSRPFGATEHDAQKLHAIWLLTIIVVRNPAHEVLCMRQAWNPQLSLPEILE